MPEDYYREELFAIDARQRGLKDVQIDGVITMGDNEESLIEAWHHANKEEKREILVTTRDSVLVDLTSKLVVALAIKPAFKPPLKAGLVNDDEGSRSLGLKLRETDVVSGDPDRI